VYTLTFIHDNDIIKSRIHNKNREVPRGGGEGGAREATAPVKKIMEGLSPS